MRKSDVQIGSTYNVKVSGRVVPVMIMRESPYGGWVGQNTKTGREVRIRTAGRLRGVYVGKSDLKRDMIG